jgi:hypothetical protein
MLVSGMIIGTLFTLFVVPSIYVLVARSRRAPAAAREDAPAVGGAGAVESVGAFEAVRPVAGTM